MSQILSSCFARAVTVAASRVDDRIPASRQPFNGEVPLLPYANDHAWAWTHYGVFVPLLPGPYRYLNTMTHIGTTGAEVFDNDALVQGDARDLTIVFSSTAARDHRHYKAYQKGEYEAAADGSHLRWGDDLTITVELPRARVQGRYDTFDVDLDLAVTDQVSYFTKTPVYEHLSLLAPYAGVIRDDGAETRVSGLATFEYARARGQQSLTRRALPPALKLPLDFFTYQVIQLDDVTQLLLTDVSARGATACRLLHVRTLGGRAEVFQDVTFEVAAWGTPQVDPWGRPMRIPAEITWHANGTGGQPLLELHGTLDAPLRFGHGRGYVSAYTYTGTFRGRPIHGSAYIEWIDVRRSVPSP